MPLRKNKPMWNPGMYVVTIAHPFKCGSESLREFHFDASKDEQQGDWKIKYHIEADMYDRTDEGRLVFWKDNAIAASIDRNWLLTLVAPVTRLP